MNKSTFATLIGLLFAFSVLSCTSGSHFAPLEAAVAHNDTEQCKTFLRALDKYQDVPSPLNGKLIELSLRTKDLDFCMLVIAHIDYKAPKFSALTEHVHQLRSEAATSSQAGSASPQRGPAPAPKQAYQNEPTGFGGLSWGDALASAANMQFLNDDPVFGVNYYQRPGDDMHFDTVPVAAVRYGFREGKFVEVVVEFRPGQWESIKRILILRYGAPPYLPQDARIISWLGPRACVIAVNPENPQVSITSTAYAEELKRRFPPSQGF